MTFNNAAWAIDGAKTAASLARTGTFALSGGGEGVILGPDLKVTPLSTPGAGVRIAKGAALVLNRYQGSSVNQMYVVTNPGTHTLSGTDMPGAPSVATNYIVAVTVGDAEFDQSGHPWMPTVIPAGTEATFQYVRPFVMTESAFNARTFPALGIARLRMRAGDATILASDIDDLRDLARPRTHSDMGNVNAPSTSNSLNGAGGVAGTYERFPNVGVLTVTIPDWAARAKIMGFVEGVALNANEPGTAKLRAYVEGTSLVGFVTNINEVSVPNQDRRSYNFSGVIDVTSVAGTSQTFSVKATPQTTASKGMLSTDGSTSVAILVQFEEKTI